MQIIKIIKKKKKKNIFKKFLKIECEDHVIPNKPKILSF